MKIDRNDSDWEAVAAKLPNGIKVALDADGLYFYAPSDDPSPFRWAIFEIDLNGDKKPDMGYYADRWGGAVNKYGANNGYMGRGRAARCKHGLELKIPRTALPARRDFRVRMTRLNNKKHETEWLVMEKRVADE